MPHPLEYYAQPGVMTDPGEFAHLFVGLPNEIEELCRVVQGLLMHPFTTRLYEVDLTAIQRREVNIRPVSEMLRRIHSLDSSPLTVSRKAAERLVGNCRDHAVLLTAMLRAQGVPARVRVGYANYFGPRLNYDHWVTEVWNDAHRRWMLVDSQIDDVQRETNQIQFDTLDVTPDRFMVAGSVWQKCRSGEAKSGNFGQNSKQRGFPFIRATVIQDLAALNKVEVLPWDFWWDLAEKKDDVLAVEERDLVDHLAALTAEQSTSAARFAELRSAYEDDPQFTMPVHSKLRLLGLSGDAKTAAGPALRPADSARLFQKDSLSDHAAAQKARQALKPQETSALEPTNIVVRGAQQHNLKHIDVTIPRYKLVVLTGVSGSGKSSLAFDTLYAEGQRRYVDSLSAYVRRYLDQMDKPKVDYIGGLSPAIAIEQKSISKNPRSTVGTVTEVLDYLRVLYSRAGTQHCPHCGRAIEPLTAQQIADRLGGLPANLRFQLLAPLQRNRKGNHAAVLEKGLQEGFSRARVDGEMVELLDGKRLPLRKSDPHTIEIIVDRLVIPDGDLPANELKDFRVRLIDSVETALQAGKGLVVVDLGGGDEVVLSEHSACPHCEITLPALNASLFSFNSPLGMCPECNGLGTRMEVDLNLIIDHPELSLLDGACRWYGNIRKKKNNKYWLGSLESIADHYGIDLETPWNDLPEKFRSVILFGSGDEKIHFSHEGESQDGEWKSESLRATRGIVYHINRLFRQTKSDYTRRWYASFMSHQLCQSCGGTRLCAEARYVTVGGKTFPEVNAMTIAEVRDWVASLMGLNGDAPLMDAGRMEIVGEVLKELYNRLQFMLNVGLYYLTLDRAAPTLSGGEGQRIRLASQLGCGLVGVLYILDEPSIGLHARDQRKLLDTLVQLRDQGNTVLVVEHDEETMRAADWLIDLGPGAGVMGGEVVSAGTPDQVAADLNSLTGRYLSGALQVLPPNGTHRREPSGWLSIYGAGLFNLKSVDVHFPLGVMTCVTGVSGSGKSSLVAETLHPALARALNNAQSTLGPYDRIEGLEQLDKVINITQDPIGRTPRSNPATYAGLFDDIRRVFASTPEARMRGYQSDRFSFNVKGGRCEQCKGHGLKKIEMHFLPDVWVLCQECKGTRYNRHTLEVTYKGKNIAEVLDMDVQEGLEFFANHTHIARVLQTLHDVGLDYVKLGQSATTLSGGEAQRVKLAKELSRVATGRTVYILDEPTTGLHFADIQRLVDVLHRLVAAGNTVIVIEHNLDVIRAADWLIDLGPEGGEGGGYIIAQGTPEEVAASRESHTGRCLRETGVRAGLE